LLTHEALLQGTESWRLLGGDKPITVRPQGRFKADNGTALAAAAAAGLGIAYLPDFLTRDHLDSGALAAVMTRYPVVEAGIFVVRPPSAYCRHHYFLANNFTDLSLDSACGSQSNGLSYLPNSVAASRSMMLRRDKKYFSNLSPNHPRQ
jgi:hypothetical protein